MKQYIIFNTVTGEVLSAPACSEDQIMHIPPQLKNAGMIEFNEVDLDLDLKGYVNIDTLEFVYFNEEQMEGKRNAGLYESVWDYSTKSWIPNESAKVNLAKKSKEDESYSNLCKHMNSPVSTISGYIDADSVSVTNIIVKHQELVSYDDEQLDSPQPDLYWRTYENTLVRFETPRIFRSWLQEVITQISERRTAAYTRWWNIKNALSAASSIEEIAAIDVSFE